VDPILPYLVICLVALLVAALTLFSGFGLGTLLMPAFALFVPLETAIAATAAVHLANNVFKVILVARDADRGAVIRFGVPAALMAFVGALLLNQLSGVPALVSFEFAGREFHITPVAISISILMMVFAFLELNPWFEKLSFDRKWLPLGGALSGFFGGLSGHQGALRAAFLVRSGLSRDAFIGTAAVCGVIVDVCRLSVYAVTLFLGSAKAGHWEGGNAVGLIIAGSLAAFVGSFIGTRLVKKVTLRSLQIIVGVMLLVLALVVGSGLIGGKA
jgi:uncharacterized membrane protein YfcA